MTQDEFIVLGFKIAEIASVVTIAAFIVYYSRVAKWWENAIGRTIVIKDFALIFTLVPSILSIFFQFNRLTSHIAGWIGVAAFSSIPVIMIWRVLVWRKIHNAKGGDLPNGRTADPADLES